MSKQIVRPIPRRHIDLKLAHRHCRTIGFGAAIDFVTDIGMQNIHDHEKAMIEYSHSRLADVEGINFIGTAEVSRRDFFPR